MLKIGTWLMGLVGGLGIKVLTALGIGWITYEAVTAAVNSAKDLVLSNWGAIPSDIFAIVSLWGFTDAVGIILAAIVARTSIVVADRLGKIAS